MFGTLRRSIDRLMLNDRSYDFLFDRPDMDEVVSLDCETTGFDPQVDDVISIAAVPISGRRIRTSDAFRAIVRPRAAMHASSIKVHQLMKKDVAGGRGIYDVLPELLRFIRNRPLIGYWIAFDVTMLNRYVQPMLDVRLPNLQIDVCDLYYDRKYGKAPPGTTLDLRFAAIANDLKLPPLQAHDAFNDAVLAAEAFVMLKDMQSCGVRLPAGATARSLPVTPVG